MPSQPRDLQAAGKGQFLLGLAQALVVVRLVIDHTAQIPFQGDPVLQHLLVQGHKPDQALDDLKHLGQIVRDQDLGLHRQFGFQLTHARRGRHLVLEYLQFHSLRSFRNVLV